MTILLTRRVWALFVITFFLQNSNILTAQNTTPQVLWQKTIGGSAWDENGETSRTADGGSISVGYTSSPISGDKTEANFSTSIDTFDIWVIKLNAAGIIEWQNTITSDRFDGAYSIKQTLDGGYIIGATSDGGISGDKTENSYGGFDYWLIKLDAVGNIQWQKTMGGAGTDVVQDVQATVDGGFVIAGYSDSGASGNKTVASLGANDMWVIKFDANGVEQWQKAHGTNAHDIVNEIKTTSDGGYILGGHVYAYSSSIPNHTYYGAYDFLLTKIDANGNLQWQKTLGGSGEDYIESLQQTTDGGYILGGTSYSGISGVKTEGNMGNLYSDYWLVKIDATGTIQWQNTIGGNSMDWIESVIQTAEGGYLLSGYSYSGVSGDKTENGHGDVDIWIVKTNSTGTIEWQKTLGGSYVDLPVSLDEINEGNGDYSYLVGALSMSDISGDKTENSQGDSDFWLVKISAVTLLTPTPSVSDVYYCPNAIAQPLTAIGQNLLWYTTPTGGVGSTTAPTPITATPGIITYYVSQTINNIESFRTPLNVVIKTPPSVGMTGMGSMCLGASQNITAYAGTAFIWNDGVTTGTRVIAPTTTTTYSVTVTGQNGCTNVATRTFTVNVPPTATIAGANTVCASSQTTLTASGGGTYRWNTGATTASINVVPQATTTYTVTVTLNGCTSVASKTVSTIGVPFSSLSFIGLANQYYKNAAPVTLAATPTGGTFRINNQIRTTLNPQQLNVGTHSVTYRYTQSGCTYMISKNVSILNPPSTSNLLAKNHLAFNSHSEPKRIRLEWYNNTGYKNDYFVVQKLNGSGEFVDIKIIKAESNHDDAELRFFTAYDEQPTEGGNQYRLKVVFKDGDTMISEIKTSQFKNGGNIAVFPNPTMDYIEINLEHYSGQPVSLGLYNAFGQAVWQQQIESVTNRVEKVDMMNMPNGHYILKVSSKGKRDSITKVVKSL